MSVESEGDDGLRMLHEDAVAPSENPSAEAGESFFELSRQMVVALDSTEWYVDWTTLVSGDIKQFAVVRQLTPSVD